MKKIYLFIAIMCNSAFILHAQDLKRANNYFDNTFYYDAIPLYEELAKTNRSKEVVQNLADSYYNTYQLPKAAKWYSYLTSVYAENLEENYFFKYSQTLKSIGEYDDSTTALIDYYTSKGATDKAEKLKKELIYLENVDAIGERFTIKSLALNTAFSEFAAAEVGDHLMYASADKKGSLSKKIFRWNHEDYLNLYQHPIAKLEMGDSLSSAVSKKINTKMHEATFAISKDMKTLYFTRNNFIKGKKHTDDKKVSHLKIYKAVLENEEWGKIEELPFNSDDFSTEHPSLSADGKTLYFSSDRPGGYGSHDLYAVSILEDGTFGEPKNLGSKINTERKEQFPYIDSNNNLYFSSNGHPGFGLLDVFVSKYIDGNFEKPDNIGKPVNGGFDDFAYTLNTDGNTGYFSSNRPEGKGSDDIYSFTTTKPLKIESCKQYVAGLITDKETGEALPGAIVSLLDSEGNSIKTITTDANASFKFMLNCAASYKIEVKKASHETNFTSLHTNKERNSVQDGSLSLLSKVDREKLNQLALEKKKQEELKKIKLAEERKRKENEKAIAANLKKEEEAKQKEKIRKEKAAKKRLQEIEKIIKSEPSIVKNKDRTIIKTEEIHFDYGMWYLRRESRARLNKLADIMKAHPKIHIEIGTHTDIRGNKNYNSQLSQKRANAVKKYLVSNGIDAKRITAKGYGETKPIVKCATPTACSEEDHEWNRRCEFVITKWE